MNPIHVSAAAAFVALAAPAPAASQAVPVGQFDSIELRGGGQVILRHGPVQRVTLIKGSTSYSRIAVDSKRDRLVIEPCVRDCPANFQFEVEVVTPRLEAVSVHGGGEIRAIDRFPAEDSLAVAVHGGGQVDVRSAGADSVAAAVHGGGVILTSPKASLVAAVHGGGEIRYWGNPASVVNSVHGGGSVTRASGN